MIHHLLLYWLLTGQSVTQQGRTLKFSFNKATLQKVTLNKQP
jgi:hypothetical protein